MIPRRETVIGHGAHARRCIAWCGLLIDSHNLEVLVDYTRYAGDWAREAVTVPGRAGSGLKTPSPFSRLDRRVVAYLRPKCTALLYDHSVNSPRTARLNVYQSFLLAAIKTHCFIAAASEHPSARTKTSFKTGHDASGSGKTEEGFGIPRAVPRRGPRGDHGGYSVHGGCGAASRGGGPRHVGRDWSDPANSRAVPRSSRLCQDFQSEAVAARGDARVAQEGHGRGDDAGGGEETGARGGRREVDDVRPDTILERQRRTFNEKRIVLIEKSCRTTCVLFTPRCVDLCVLRVCVHACLRRLSSCVHVSLSVGPGG